MTVFSSLPFSLVLGIQPRALHVKGEWFALTQPLSERMSHCEARN